MSNRKGIGSHQSANMGKDEWLTPPEILKALGKFDLDPCSPIVRPWDTATEHFNINHDGLKQKWFGRVWCNPPYGLESAEWLSVLAAHGEGTALIFARTETKMFFEQVWNKANAVLFIEGRLHFHHVDGTRAKANAGAPSVLVAYGRNDAEILKNCGIKGHFECLKPEQSIEDLQVALAGYNNLNNYIQKNQFGRIGENYGDIALRMIINNMPKN